MGELLLKKKKQDKMLKKSKAELEYLKSHGQGFTDAAKKIEEKCNDLGAEIKKLQKEAKDLLKDEKQYMNE